MSYFVPGVDVTSEQLTAGEVEKETVQAFKKAGYEVSVKCIKMTGSGGGWPVVDLTFPDYGVARKAMIWFCDDEDEGLQMIEPGRQLNDNI